MRKDGKTVIIRPLMERDLEALVRWNNDPEVEQFMDGPQPQNLEECKEWYRDCDHTRNYRLYALENEKGILLGELELDHIVWRRKEAELRICIGEKNYWNQGYGRAAIESLLGLAFSQLNLNHVYLRVYLFNERAIRCYEHVGFRRNACLRRKNDQNWKPLLLMDIKKENFIMAQHKHHA
ncbi:MAG TPA: GNAT family N-acetyltransferase, partial [Bacillota bacterium]|nr:GNAT family N-acetyltransferase [Bacillota bacterium]